MKRVKTDDGMLIYTIDKKLLTEITLLKMPQEPYTIRIPKRLKGTMIEEIGAPLEKSSILFKNIFCVDESISDDYLQKGYDLISFQIDDRISVIHPGAFCKLRANNFHWPLSCRHIPNNCFGYSRIKNFTGMEKVETIYIQSFVGAGGCENFVLPDTLNYIGEEAFGKSLFNKITGGKNVETIKPFAFKMAAIKEFCWPEKCKRIPDCCFSSCDNLEEVNNTKYVTSISYAAFSDCKKLNGFNFSTNLESIGSKAFARTGLKEVDLSETMVEDIGDYAFDDISTFKSFIPNPLCVVTSNVFNLQ